MKRDLNIKTLAVALLLSTVAINTMNAKSMPVTRTRMSTEPSSAVDRTLFQAVRKGDTRTIIDLIKKEDANVNARSKEGTPLIIAAKLSTDNPKMAKVVKTLLRNGANASLQGPGGMTALMWAAQGGAHGTVEVLLRNKGAQKTIDMKDTKGNDALDYASQKGGTKTTNLLLRYEAMPTKMTIAKAGSKETKKILQEKFNELKKAGKELKKAGKLPIERIKERFEQKPLRRTY